MKSDPPPIPDAVLELIAKRSGNATVSAMATAFAEQALRRDCDLAAQSSTAARYFRVVCSGSTVAYVHPRALAVRVDYRSPGGPLGVWMKLQPRQRARWDRVGHRRADEFQVSLRLLDDAIGRAVAWEGASG